MEKSKKGDKSEKEAKQRNERVKEKIKECEGKILLS